MEFYQLEELAAFARYGTISKAAELSGVSQPAMSRAMKLLEEDLGVAIFRRTANTIELNETGRLACQWAERIIRMADSAKEEIRAFDRRQRTLLVGSVAPAPLWSAVSVLSALETEKTVAGEMRSGRILAEGLKAVHTASSSRQILLPSAAFLPSGLERRTSCSCCPGITGMQKENR